MKVITLAKTKELLGITDTLSDAAITAKIPIVDSKVKQITSNRYNMQISCNTIAGSPYVEVFTIITYSGTNFALNNANHRFYSSGINNPYYIDDLNEYIGIGQLIEGDGIPDDSYIDEAFYDGTSFEISGNTYGIPFIKLNANATKTATGVQMFLGIEIAYQDIIAKGIQYLINKTSTIIPGKDISSVGSVSYTDADDSFNNQYGMPGWFVKALPSFMSGH